MRLKLSDKAFILVAVPLVFELIFIAILASLLQQAETEIHKVDRARAIIAQMNKLHGLLTAEAGGLSNYGLSASEVKAKNGGRTVDMVPGVLAELKNLVRDDADELRRAEEFERFIMETLTDFRKVRSMITESSIWEARDFLRSFKPKARQLSEKMEQLLGKERALEAKSPAIQDQYRNNVKAWLAAGILLNIVLAVCLAVYFNRGTTRRLSVLVDNTCKLASGKPLNPPVGGADEIGHLDRVFNEMADALKQTARLKEEFVSMISHELRSPLTAIQAFLSLMAEGVYGELNEHGKNKVTVAERNCTRLIKLINDLLDIDKMQAGKLSLNISRISLGDVVARSIDAVRGIAEQERIDVQMEDIDTDIEADSERLIQVMINLLSNALKFSPPGSAVTVRHIETADAVEVRVCDQGVGIAESYQKVIFERFEQVMPGDGKKRAGSGLGLTICKAIIAQHNGLIGVESEEDRGSTFWFRLPKLQPDHRAEKEGATHANA